MTIGTMQIKVEQREVSKIDQVDFDNLAFGRVFSDHMLEMEYKDGSWQDPKIIPYGPISLDPGLTTLHYAQSIFEGLKAYKNEAGEIFLFRPDENIKRMNRSAERMCMPEIPEDLFMEGIKQLVKLDEKWIPLESQGSLYIRPLMFGSDEFIGVRASDTYRFYIMTGPAGGYYSEPVRVKVETEFTRAAEGGVGAAKTAGNYAASLYPAKLANNQGYDQLIWTDGKEHKFIEESGTMNVMFQINGTIITPPLSSSILPGITRNTVLQVAEKWGVPVEERKISVEEVISSLEQGTLTDAFGVGTAATIAHIKTIAYDDVDYELPEVESRDFSNKILTYLNDYQRGRVEDELGWTVKIS